MTIASSPQLLTTSVNRNVAFGVTMALISVFFWGSNAVIIRHLVLDGVSMSVVAFLRVAIGGVVVTAWVLFTEPATLAIPTRLRDRWFWIALIFYGGNMLVFHWALRFTSASVVMLLENIAPVVALFGGAWFFREHITSKALVALILALGGVGLVCLADPGLAVASRSGTGWGNVLALLAGLTWGGFTLACKGQGCETGDARAGMSSMAVMLLGSALLLVPLLIGTHGWPVTPEAWGWVLLLGVTHTALATVLWRLALTHISAFTASIIFLLTIVLTMGNAAFFLKERVTPLMLASACCICAALITMVAMPRIPGTSSDFLPSSAAADKHPPLVINPNKETHKKRELK